jgi:hypothetical protein
MGLNAEERQRLARRPPTVPGAIVGAAVCARHGGAKGLNWRDG